MKVPLSELLDSIPKHLHQRALRYRSERDQYNFILGRVLLREGLGPLGMGDQLDLISYNDNGKPVHPNVYFNISHSSDMVVCALSTKGALGIDVEYTASVDLVNFRRWFTDTEWADIEGASQPLRRFYWYWTRKESVIKALGISLFHLNQLSLDASGDVFLSNGEQWLLRELDFGSDYCGALCSQTDEKYTIKMYHPPL